MIGLDLGPGERGSKFVADGIEIPEMSKFKYFDVRVFLVVRDVKV